MLNKELIKAYKTISKFEEREIEKDYGIKFTKKMFYYEHPFDVIIIPKTYLQKDLIKTKHWSLFLIMCMLIGETIIRIITIPILFVASLGLGIIMEIGERISKRRKKCVN